MCFDKVQGGIEYIRTYHSDKQRPNYVITTNGLLLRGRMLDYLVENDIKIMLSLDGAFDSQGKHRIAFGNNQRAVIFQIRFEKVLH